MNDGELVILSDGNRRCIFEFDTNGVTPGTHTPVAIAAGAESIAIAQSLQTAIFMATRDALEPGCTAPGTRPSELRLRVTREERTLELRHVSAGAVGNQPIIESVANSDFTVASLSGGAGHDCPVDMGCTKDHDCAPGDGTLHCLKEVGQTVGKCGPRP
ncbi:hypothetical protein [Myxococcus sp. CA033]|uniref:hypothetical protein n=1 Tax=Myxococcus sp. CA033 TaxID=2741516 RepID=UPI0020C657DF|nr:hypothetical protein [Myxococcus sp. CA033]